MDSTSSPSHSPWSPCRLHVHQAFGLSQCPFCDGVTIYGNTDKYTSVIYHLELFSGVNSMVMSIVHSDHIYAYGNPSKYASVMYHLKLFFNVKPIVMFVLWSEWPHIAIETKKFLKTLSRLRSKTRKLDNVKAKSRTKKFLKYNIMAKIQDNKVSQDNVKAKIQDSIQVVAQLVFQ